MTNEWTRSVSTAGIESTEDIPPACPSTPHLLIVAANGTWTSRPLPTRGALTIGRDSDADIRVDERSVSRRHARLEVTGVGELRLVDLDSANGLRVGDALVRGTGVTLRPGEPVLIGRTAITLHVPSPTQAAEPGPQPLRDRKSVV